MLNFRHTAAGIVEGTQPAGRQEDEPRAPVAGIGPALEVSEVLELGDQLRRGREAQLRLGGEVRETDSVDAAEVAEDLEVRLAQVPISVLSRGGEQFHAELSEKAAEELADGQPIAGQVL